jgi:hypothetical protein
MAISQTQYINEMAATFKVTDSAPVHTPALVDHLDASSCPKVDSPEALTMATIPYRGIVGSLNFLACISRPDIAFTVSRLSRFMQNPGLAHWRAALRCLTYCVTTKHLPLQLKVVDLATAQLIGYADADWGGERDGRRSVSGYTFAIGNLGEPPTSGCISHSARLNKCAALSTAEAEYIALCAAVREALFLRNLLESLGFMQCQATTIYEDNAPCIAMAKNPVRHDANKHIELRYHFVRFQWAARRIAVAPVATQYQFADILTKALPRPAHEFFTKGLLGIHSLRPAAAAADRGGVLA